MADARLSTWLASEIALPCYLGTRQNTMEKTRFCNKLSGFQTGCHWLQERTVPHLPVSLYIGENLKQRPQERT